MDKLALIKQKYGYVSTSNPNYSSNKTPGKENSSSKPLSYQKIEHPYITSTVSRTSVESQ